MKLGFVVLGSILALGLAACETASTDGGMAAGKKGGGKEDSGKAGAKEEALSAKALAKEFAKGTVTCAWTKPDGSKGKDFYFKTAGPNSGDADRNVGGKTMQGRWKIVGQGFYINFGKGKKAIGDWHKVAKTGNKSYKFYKADGGLAMTAKCK